MISLQFLHFNLSWFHSNPRPIPEHPKLVDCFKTEMVSRHIYGQILDKTQSPQNQKPNVVIESAVDCFKAEAASRRIYGRIQQIQDRNLIEIQVEK